MAPEKWMKLEDFFVSFQEFYCSIRFYVSFMKGTNWNDPPSSPLDFILKLLGSCLRRQVAARLCNEVSTDATPCRRELFQKHKDWCSEVKIPESLNGTYKLMRNQIYGKFLNYQYWADQNGIKQRKSIMLRSFPSKIMPLFELVWYNAPCYSEELVR